MSEDQLAGFIAKAMLFWDAVMATPFVGASVRALGFLTGMSGAFWTVSSFCGWLALKIHDALFAEFAELFALTYNIVLASLFGGVMALAVHHRAAGSDFVLAYEGAGFVLVYLVLSAAYANARGTVDPHSGAGFAGGVAAYLLGSLFPAPLAAHPLVQSAHELTLWIVASPAGKILMALSVVQGVVQAARKVRAWFFWKSVRVGKKRFFFEPDWRTA